MVKRNLDSTPKKDIYCIFSNPENYIEKEKHFFILQ
jgi:hypothetical protein